MRVLSFMFAIFLLSYTTDATLVDKEPDPNPDPNRQSFLDNAFLSAITYGQNEDARGFLALGANPNVFKLSFPPNSWSAIAKVIYSKDEVLLETMLQKGGKAQIAMLHASYGNDDVAISMAELCLEYGADIHDPKLLENAISRGSLRMVQFLVKEGADAMASNVIKFAIQKGNAEIVNFLLKLGADYQTPSPGSYWNRLERPYFFAYFDHMRGYRYLRISRARLPQVQALFEELGVDKNEPCFLGKSLNEWAEKMDSRGEYILWDGPLPWVTSSL